MSVERLKPGAAVIRIAGQWSRVGAARVGRQVEQQLGCGRAHPGARAQDVIIDLAEVALR